MNSLKQPSLNAGKKILLVASLFFVILSAVSGASDGFESGAFDDGNPITWDDESGSNANPTVQSGVVFNGTYALNLSSTGGSGDDKAAIKHERPAGQEIDINDSTWLTGYVRTPDVGKTAAARYSYGTSYNSNSNVAENDAVLFRIGSNQFRVQTKDSSGSSISTVTGGSPIDAWYLVNFTFDTVNDEVDVVVEYTNGTVAHSFTDVSYSGAEDFSIIALQAYQDDTTSYYDEISYTAAALEGGADGPSITVHDPQNKTYQSNNVSLSVTADEQVDTWLYELDGNGTNVTFTPNTTLSGLADGYHKVTVWANDTDGNWNSKTRRFGVNYVNESAAIPTSLKFWARMNDTGTTVKDWSDAGNNGNTHGSITQQVEGVLNPFGDWGDGEAMDFDGQDDYISIPDSAALDGQSAMAFSFHFNVDSLGTNDRTFINKDDSGFNSRTYRVFYESAVGGIRLAIGDGSGNYDVQCDANDTSFQSDTTYHFVGTVNETHSAVYVDGERENLCSSGRQVPDTDTSINIGRTHADSHYVDGWMDEIQILNEWVNTTEAESLAKNNTIGDLSGDPSITLVSPTDGEGDVNDTDDAEGVDVDVSVSVSDADNSTLESVRFFWSNGSEFYSEQDVSSGATVSTQLENLAAGTQYSWYVEADDGVTTTQTENYTFVTALSRSDLQLVQVASNVGRKSVYTQRPHAAYAESVDKTFIVYRGASADPYIRVYDHENGTFGSSVKIGTNPLSDTDNHGPPTICLGDSGTLHVFHGAHNSKLQYAHSDSPYNETSWTNENLESLPDLTYPSCAVHNGSIYVAGRAGSGHGSSYPSHEFSYLLESTDGGSTWEDYNLTDTTGTDGSASDSYVGQLSSEPDGLHITWYVYSGSGHGDTGRGAFHGIIDVENQEIVDLKGNGFAWPVNWSEMDSQGVLRATPDRHMNIFRHAVNGSTVYVSGADLTNGNQKFWTWNGSSWVEETIPGSKDGEGGMRITSEGNVEVYQGEYDTDPWLRHTKHVISGTWSSEIIKDDVQMHTAAVVRDAPDTRMTSIAVTGNGSIANDDFDQELFGALNQSNLTAETPPSISSLTASPDPVDTGSTVNTSAKITDDGTLDKTLCTYRDADGNVEVDNVSMSTNGSWYWCTHTITEEPSNIGDWTAEIWANDTDGASSTDSTTFTVNDGTPPSWRNLQDNASSPTYPNKTINISSEFRDEGIGLNKGRLSTNETGTWRNWSDFSDRYNFNDLSSENSGPVDLHKGRDGYWYYAADFDSSNHVYRYYENWTYTGDSFNLSSEVSTFNGMFQNSSGYWHVFEPDTVHVYYENWTYTGTNHGLFLGSVAQDGFKHGDNWYVVSKDIGEGWVDVYNSNFSSYQNAHNITSEVSSPETIYRSDNGYWWVGSAGSGTGANSVVKYYDNWTYTGELHSLTDLNSNAHISGLYQTSVGWHVLERWSDGVYDMSRDQYGSEDDLGGVAETWKQTAFDWINTTFNGVIGYKIWGQDQNENWDVTDTDSFLSTYTPSYTDQTITWNNIAGSETKQLNLTIDDSGEEDISDHNSPPSGSEGQFSNSTLRIDGWSLGAFDWMATVTDRFGRTSPGFSVNFTTTDNGLQEDNRSHSLSTQYVNRSVELQNRGPNAADYDITLSDEGTVVIDGSRSGTVASGNAVSSTEVWKGDFITGETFDTYKLWPKNSLTHTLDTQYISNQTNLTATNGKSFQFTDVDLSSSCDVTTTADVPPGTNEITQSCSNVTYSGDWISVDTEDTFETGQNASRDSSTSTQYLWNQTSLSVTNAKSFKFSSVDISNQCSVTTTSDVPGGTSDVTTSCNNDTYTGDWIDETEYDFDLQPDEVTIGVNYIGDRNLELAEQKSASWTDIDTTPGVTTPTGCSQTNNTKVDLNADATANFTVEMSCDPGDEGNPGLIKTNDATDDNQTKYNYTTNDLNITSNETRDVNVTWKIDKDELNDFLDRNNESGYIDGSSTGVEVDTDADFVYVTFTTDCCSSSPAEGQHQASLVYFVGDEETTPVDDGGSGGGGGGGGQEAETQIGFVTEEYGVPYGETQTPTFEIRNLAREENTVTIERGSSEMCEYVEVKATLSQNSVFSDTGTYQMPPRTESLIGDHSSAQVPVSITMPNETVLRQLSANETLRCEFETSATVGAAENLVIEAEPAPATPTGLVIVADFFEDLIDAPLTSTTELCIGQSTHDHYWNDEPCAAEDVVQAPLPTVPGFVAILFFAVLFAGFLRLAVFRS